MNINLGNMEKAQTLLDLCPATEASTQYLNFLVAATQNRPLGGEPLASLQLTEAMSAANAILTCPDLDAKQLLLMAYVVRMGFS